MSEGLSRRELFLMGNAIAVPTLLGRLDASLEAAAAAGPLKAGPQIYQSIGVEPVINCRGTFTIIGGSVELPEVRAAMDAAARYFVQIDELADAVGRRFAELTGAEWGMVSAGCAAGLKHVTVACVTGGNPEKLIRIPDLSGLDKTEVIVPRSSRRVPAWKIVTPSTPPASSRPSIGTPKRGASGYPWLARTTQQAGRGSHSTGTSSSVPSHAASSVSSRSPWNLAISGWHSGSPNRTLNSSTLGPAWVRMSPA